MNLRRILLFSRREAAVLFALHSKKSLRMDTHHTKALFSFSSSASGRGAQGQKHLYPSRPEQVTAIKTSRTERFIKAHFPPSRDEPLRQQQNAVPSTARRCVSKAAFYRHSKRSHRMQPFTNFTGTSMRAATCSGVIPPSKKRRHTVFMLSPTSTI